MGRIQMWLSSIGFVALAVVTLQAAEIQLTVMSDPIGATVYQAPLANSETTQFMGYAPLLLKYQKPRRWVECLKTNEIRVRWISGAEASLAVDLCPRTGSKQQFIFVRPSGVPGLEIDAHYAAALIGAAAAQVRPPEPEITISMPKRCTSTLIGNQVFTNCTGG